MAVAGMLMGAGVVGRVMFGITLMVASGAVAVDGLLRHAPAEQDVSVPEPIERWRRAR